MLVVSVKFYDYFGGEKTTTKKYNNLLEGWNAFKNSRAKDFIYDDAFQRTSVYIRHDFTAPKFPQRPHARTKYEWEKMCEEKEKAEFEASHCGFNEAEFKFLTHLFIDGKDINIEDDILNW